jgi:hypothetical protein
MSTYHHAAVLPCPFHPTHNTRSLKEFLVKAGFERALLDYLQPSVYHRLRTMKQSKRLTQKGQLGNIVGSVKLPC